MDAPQAEPQEHELNDPEQTEAWGERLAQTLEAGAIVALEGELGAGKTTLVRGLARGLGIDPSAVSSPTFALMNEYEGGRLTLVHIDAYRLGNAGELAALGWDRLMEDPAVVIVVEWPGKVEGALPPHRTTTITLEHAGEQQRHATLNPPRGWTTCPTSGKRVPPDSPTWPFADRQAQLVDLYGWFAGTHKLSRPVDPDRDDLSDLPHAPPEDDPQPPG